MHRVVAALVVLALLGGGCFSYREAKQDAILGGITTLVSTGVVAVGLGTEQDSLAGFGAVMTFVGVALAVGGVLGMAVFDETPENPPVLVEGSRPAVAPPGRQRAWAITKQAAAAARANDCTTVIRHDPDVYELDPELHATVFMRDAAIKRCLEAGGAPKEP